MIQNLKDLEKLLKLCRKQGVIEISTTEISFKLGELPVKHTLNDSIEETEEQYNPFDEPLTNEELVAFSNGAN